MEGFWKVVGAVLLAAVLIPALERREFSLLLTMLVCTLAAGAAVVYLEPVLDLMWELKALAELSDGFLSVLLKAVGIALVAEIASVICRDAGNGALAKSLLFLAGGTILYLSVPLFQALVQLLQEILLQV